MSEPKASPHTHTRAANIHTTHKGMNKSTDGGGGEAAGPIGTFVRARAARARPFVCGENVGGTRVCVG